MKKHLLLLIGITAFLFACSSPLNKKYNEETFAEDLEAIKEEIDASEFETLAISLVRMKLEGQSLEKMTYKEILKQGKKWKAEADELAEKEAKEEADKIERLAKVVDVSFVDKKFIEGELEDYLQFEINIHNKSDKTITEIKGKVTFTDLSDEKIVSMNLTCEKTIEAGKKVTWLPATTCNPFIEEDEILKNKDSKELKFIWIPDQITFEDGTTIE